jgi:hypothetical protein
MSDDDAFDAFMNSQEADDIFRRPLFTPGEVAMDAFIHPDFLRGILLTPKSADEQEAVDKFFTKDTILDLAYAVVRHIDIEKLMKGNHAFSLDDFVDHPTCMKWVDYFKDNPDLTPKDINDGLYYQLDQKFREENL